MTGAAAAMCASTGHEQRHIIAEHCHRRKERQCCTTVRRHARAGSWRASVQWFWKLTFTSPDSRSEVMTEVFPSFTARRRGRFFFVVWSDIAARVLQPPRPGSHATARRGQKLVNTTRGGWEEEGKGARTLRPGLG